MTLIGLITDGGVGLQTGNVGKYVAYKSGSKFARKCKNIRILKLWNAIDEEPKIKSNFKILLDCNTINELQNKINNLDEIDIWKLFDEIKEQYGIKIFGKGFMYKIVPEKLIFDTRNISEHQKLNGIYSLDCFVYYDKGDKEGNRWYVDTPYLIDWSEAAVNQLKNADDARWQGYNFFFRNGFCWTNVLNPNSIYFKCRLKDRTINDIGSMALYDEFGIGDKFYVCIVNSFLGFKTMREFFNSSVNITTNDIKKLPIKIPSEKELMGFNQKFDECLIIKKKYFSGEIDRREMNIQLRPIEIEIDKMVNNFYGIDIDEEIDFDDVEEEVTIDEEIENEDE